MYKLKKDIGDSCWMNDALIRKCCTLSGYIYMSQLQDAMLAVIIKNKPDDQDFGTLFSVMALCYSTFTRLLNMVLNIFSCEKKAQTLDFRLAQLYG